MDKRPPMIILAGGLGTRLGSLTSNMPKAMVPINGKPFLLYLIKELERQGFDRFIISTGFKGEVIELYPWNKYIDGIISFHRDTKMKGPMNALMDTFHAYDLCNAFVCNGDTFPLFLLPNASASCVAARFFKNDIDTGIAYYSSYYFAKSYDPKTYNFIDIGTPDGLQAFTDHISRPAPR